MQKRKNIKLKGKISFSQYFQEFSEGDKVAIVREHSQAPKFPKRIQGLVGVITGQRGSAYLVNVKDGGMEKMHIIRPVHLKKLK